MKCKAFKIKFRLKVFPFNQSHSIWSICYSMKPQLHQLFVIEKQKSTLKEDGVWLPFYSLIKYKCFYFSYCLRKCLTVFHSLQKIIHDAFLCSPSTSKHSFIFQWVLFSFSPLPKYYKQLLFKKLFCKKIYISSYIYPLYICFIYI